MTASEFMAIAPMFASEDVTRPLLREPFRCGAHLFATDGRIALAYRARCMELCGIAETTDEKQLGIGKSIMGMIESNDAKIASGEYQGYGLCSMMEAVVAAFANVEPDMMWLRANEPDEDDPCADCSPDSVRHVHESSTCVIMANPARALIEGYYASLIAGLMKHHGPVEAYADVGDPNAMLYFRGPDWNCALMPLLTHLKSTDWNRYSGRAIADAYTGGLVWGRDEEKSPDIDTLRTLRNGGAITETTQTTNNETGGQPMSDINTESFADKIAEWRECLDAADPAVWNDRRIAGLVENEVRHQREYMNRLEAVHRRELAAVSGNAAKLRAALKPWIAFAEWLLENAGKDGLGKAIQENGPAIRQGLEELRATLAAPPRQCDVGTVAEQLKRQHDTICNTTKACPDSDWSCKKCFAEWAQMPYEAKKGGAKCG